MEIRVALDTNRLTDLFRGDSALAGRLEACDEIRIPLMVLGEIDLRNVWASEDGFLCFGSPTRIVVRYGFDRCWLASIIERKREVSGGSDAQSLRHEEIGGSSSCRHQHECSESNSMNAEWNKIAELIPNVLRSWNIAPDDVTPISRKGNSHWRVRRGRDDFVLRMYRRGQSEPSIQYELDILKRLRSQGWPVAAAVEETVLHSGFIFALFPLLPGCAHQGETAEQRRCRGRILGELHRELSAVTDVGQRTGWQRADEVVQDSEARRLRGNDMHRTIALDLERVRDRLLTAGAASFPVAIIHGDFISQNLLFQAEALSGVLDFDSVHLDLRAADVACARRSSHDDVVRGYLEIAPLTDAELGCLDDLWRATVLRYALQILGGRVAAETDEPELQWCVKQLEKTIPFGGNAG